MDLGCLHQADGGGAQEAGGDGRRDGAEQKRMKMTDGSPPARSLRSPWTGRSQRT